MVSSMASAISDGRLAVPEQAHWHREGERDADDAAEEEDRLEPGDLGRDAEQPHAEDEQGHGDDEWNGIHDDLHRVGWGRAGHAERHSIERLDPGAGPNGPSRSRLDRSQPRVRDRLPGGVVARRVEDACEHVALQAPELIAREVARPARNAHAPVDDLAGALGGADLDARELREPE